MRPLTEVTTSRRVDLVKLLVNPQEKSDICDFDSYYKMETVHRFIKRLRESGIRISSVRRFEGKEKVYQLDMSLIDAIHLIRPEMTQEEMEAEAARRTEARRKVGLKVQRKKNEAYRESDGFTPWYGILTRSESINIGVRRCK